MQKGVAKSQTDPLLETGAGVLLNVMLQLTRLPCIPGLPSVIHSFHVPSALLPLLTAPRTPSGLNDPVNGAKPAVIDVAALMLKQVPV